MIVDAVRQFLRDRGIAPCGIVAAVSGGADSLALLLALSELRSDGFTITCGHVNHHLRGEESDGDEAFVRAFAEVRGIPVVVADGTLPEDLVRSHGIEGAAREVRTVALRRIRSGAGAPFVATAHQKNDQAETVLMRLLTGTGLAGLRAIHPVRDDGFLRPLLDVSRAEIERFLREQGVTPRVDRMNSDPRYLRTRVRAALAMLDTENVDSLAAVAEEAGEQWQTLERLLDSIRGIETDDDETRFTMIPAEPWLREALLNRHIRRLDPRSRDVSAADIKRLSAAMATATRITVTKSVELIRRGDALVLRRIPPPIVPYEFSLAPGEEKHIDLVDHAHIRVDTLTGGGDVRTGGRTQAFQLPPGATPSFIVRNRREGDRFQPLGMTAEKRLKDFLIDRKVPRDDRDRLPLLIWNGEIVWVGGVEVSERFKLDDRPGDRYVARIE